MFILTPAWISLLGNAFWIKATSQETVLERLLQMGKGVRHPAWQPEFDLETYMLEEKNQFHKGVSI